MWTRKFRQPERILAVALSLLILLVAVFAYTLPEQITKHIEQRSASMGQSLATAFALVLPSWDERDAFYLPPDFSERLHRIKGPDADTPQLYAGMPDTDGEDTLLQIMRDSRNETEERTTVTDHVRALN